MKTGLKAKKKYIKELKMYLCAKKETKDRLIDDLSSDIDLYLSENRNATLKELHSKFGEPINLAKQFANADDVVFTKKRKIGIVITKIVSALLVAVLLYVIGTVIHAVFIYNPENDYYKIMVGESESTYENEGETK